MKTAQQENLGPQACDLHAKPLTHASFVGQLALEFANGAEETKDYLAA